MTYINDSKATNTDAVEKALTAFPNESRDLVTGGADKGTPLDEFMSVVVEHATAVVCFGAPASDSAPPWPRLPLPPRSDIARGR